MQVGNRQPWLALVSLGSAGEMDPVHRWSSTTIGRIFGTPEDEFWSDESAQRSQALPGPDLQRNSSDALLVAASPSASSGICLLLGRKASRLFQRLRNACSSLQKWRLMRGLAKERVQIRVVVPEAMNQDDK